MKKIENIFFPKVTPRQWKQQLQFLLEGRDYNDTYLWHSEEGVVVKPFYYQHCHSEPLKGVDTKVSVFLYVTQVSTLLKQIERWNSKSVESFVLRVHNPKDYLTLVEHLPLGNIYFVEIPFYEIPEEVLKVIKDRGLNLFWQWDFIGNFARYGNWFSNEQNDKTTFKNFITTANASLTVDSRIFQEAGASMVQQLAYSLLVWDAYLPLLSQQTTSKTVFIKVSVGGNYFFEIAKLQVFRELFQKKIQESQQPFDLKIIAQPSKRELSLSQAVHNTTKVQLAMESIFLSSAVDYVMPIQVEFYKKDRFTYLEKVVDLTHHPIGNDSYYIQSLAEELTSKSTILYRELAALGGILKALKTHLIQRKIAEHSEKMELSKSQNPMAYLSKEEWELFPFLKKKTRKTLIRPLLPKRIGEDQEKEFYKIY